MLLSVTQNNIFMNKQEMNRSFAFADHRQQVLDIRIRLALQCIDFPITSFLMIELTIINKTLTEIVSLDLCISSHTMVFHTPSPLQSSQKFRRHSDQDYFPYKRFLPEIKFPARVFAFFRTLLSPTLRADFSNVFFVFSAALIL